jgi:hypothetical protein
MGVIQAANEKEVGDLLKHLHGVRAAAEPEGVPDVVDLGAWFASEHGGESFFCLVESKAEQSASSP